ncbi:MAG: chitobiase/beta-hexosaminidase C-terminal domain-containing protein [Ignavibacteriae bacterium]|nr:chitobiase/beta-hexosaminidase C-terminal domain-containing protein [Ignavibacteriota bacterium]
MKTKLSKSFFLLIILSAIMQAQTNWKPVDGNIMTKWANDVNPENVLPEYPRPNMVRNEWINLNGIWNYELTNLNVKPQKFDKEILVPFAIESALSGVKQAINDSTLLWYQKSFPVPKSWNNKRILINFEAVDWLTKVWINDNLVGEHKGGYDPFSFDITEFLSNDSEQTLTVSVWDPTDKGTQPCGKQVQNPGGIFYTSVTGIWQTVWLEPVSDIHIQNYFVVSNIDEEIITIKLNTINTNSENDVKIFVKDQDKIINSYSGKVKDSVQLKIDNPKLWSPNNPFLYDLEIELGNGDNVFDKVAGYFGMRKISLNKDDFGRLKIFLNNEFVFQNGPLDQGFWPDGIYTAPTDEALKYDIEITKELGFNMLRKHVKVEPRRFYYWCDKLGILVWQDMPSGDKKIAPEEPDIIRTKESAAQFETELEQLIISKYNHPSIIMWVPFNEGWGQYHTDRIVNKIKMLDPSRLVNNTSGWADRNVGDVYDIHSYPAPRLPEAQKDRAIVIGEFGGMGLKVENHVWTNDNWGYVSFSNPTELLNTYEEYYTSIWDYVKNSALSAVVYTQTTDVETEVNGLLTYDRKIIKYDKDALRNINTNNYIKAPKIKPAGGLINIGDKIEILSDDQDSIYYTLDETEPTINSLKYKFPIEIESNTVVKAKVIIDKRESRIITEEYNTTEIPRPDYIFPFSEKFHAGGSFALLDGKFGSTQYSDGNWQGFEGNNAEIIIQVDKSKSSNKIKMNFLEDLDRWIFFPSSVSLKYSNDGSNFTLLNTIEIDQPTKYRDANIKNISFDVSNIDFTNIKIEATNIGKCPTWHKGSGGKTWIFIDEIEFNE